MCVEEREKGRGGEERMEEEREGEGMERGGEGVEGRGEDSW